MAEKRTDIPQECNDCPDFEKCWSEESLEEQEKINAAMNNLLAKVEETANILFPETETNRATYTVLSAMLEVVAMKILSAQGVFAPTSDLSN